MTTPLSPREIQSRIRSGASLADLAQESGMDVDRIEPFAAPVLAEREHVAGTALQCPVRRRGESSSGRSLRAVAQEHLQKLGVDDDEVEWDAWREEDRSWTLRGIWTQGEDAKEALLKFDQRGRFSVARNDDARLLIGESIPGMRRDHDAEPTIDLSDELALVRAVQGEAPLADERVTRQVLQQVEQETVRLPRPTPEQVAARLDPRPSAGAADEAPSPAQQPAGTEQADDAVVPQEADETEVPDYAEIELEQVDGVYDIVPRSIGEMDVLYEMLSSFNEDSVNIYAGLTDPIAPQVLVDAHGRDDQPVDADEPTDEESWSTQDQADAADDAATKDVASDEETSDEAAEPTALIPRPELSAAAPAASKPVPTQAPEPLSDPLEQDHLEGLDDEFLAGVVTEVVSEPAPEVEDQPQPGVDTDESPSEESTTAESTSDEAPGQAAPSHEAPADTVEANAEAEARVVVAEAAHVLPAVVAPVQDELVAEPIQERKPLAKKRKSSKRASVPSWDEIMFGAPTPGKKD